jgi:hypothetical protein
MSTFSGRVATQNKVLLLQTFRVAALFSASCSWALSDQNSHDYLQSQCRTISRSPPALRPAGLPTLR